MKSKHTELFSEYLENGGELPAAFELIPALNDVTFAELFAERYFDREIGFETEIQFAARLNAKADVVCPFYAGLIASIGDVMAGDTRKVRVTRDNTALSSNFTNPINETIGTPKVGNLSGQTQVKTDDDETTAFSGASVDDQIRLNEQWQKGFTGLYSALLNAFEPLFLGVY